MSLGPWIVVAVRSKSCHSLRHRAPGNRGVVAANARNNSAVVLSASWVKGSAVDVHRAYDVVVAAIVRSLGRVHRTTAAGGYGVCRCVASLIRACSRSGPR